MPNSDTHVDDFQTIMQEYNIPASIDMWSTADLVDLSNIIDIELQQRAAQEVAEQGLDYEEPDTLPWEEDDAG